MSYKKKNDMLNRERENWGYKWKRDTGTNMAIGWDLGGGIGSQQENGKGDFHWMKLEKSMSKLDVNKQKITQ